MWLSCFILISIKAEVYWRPCCNTLALVAICRGMSLYSSQWTLKSVDVHICWTVLLGTLWCFCMPPFSPLQLQPLHVTGKKLSQKMCKQHSWEETYCSTKKTQNWSLLLCWAPAHVSCSPWLISIGLQYQESQLSLRPFWSHISPDLHEHHEPVVWLHEFFTFWPH